MGKNRRKPCHLERVEDVSERSNPKIVGENQTPEEFPIGPSVVLTQSYA